MILNWNYKGLFQEFSSQNEWKILLGGTWGLEKESLRVTKDKKLALTSHAQALGDLANDSSFTTDFSESQVEIITPPCSSIDEAFSSLEVLEDKLENALENEVVWPFSMPCELPEEDIIPLAKFEDKTKEIYRNGLALRYGKKCK